MSYPSRPLRATVAVLTYKRPSDLAELLQALAEQCDSVEDEVSVLVVDNDPLASGRETARSCSSELVRYVHEPTPGIAAGRNRAIDEAGDADVLVFIDDDERPTDHWLERLLEAYAETRPQAVAGPVVSSYPSEPEAWIRDGGFFERRRYASGTLLPAAATNNLLLDLRAVRASGVRFDESFSLTGGSDTMFTRRLRSLGAEIVWCDEAVVVDVVPTARLNRHWVLQRAYRSANSWSRTTLALAESPAARFRARAECTTMGLERIVGGAGMWAFGIVTGRRAHEARGCRAMARGSGMLLGAWGFVYAEYSRVRRRVGATT